MPPRSRGNVNVAELLASWQVGGSRGGWKSFLHHISKTMPRKRRAVSLKAAKKLPRVLVPGQVQTLLDACEHLRDRLLLALLYDTGIFSGGRPWGRVSAPGVCAGQRLILRF